MGTHCHLTPSRPPKRPKPFCLARSVTGSMTSSSDICVPSKPFWGCVKSSVYSPIYVLPCYFHLWPRLPALSPRLWRGWIYSLCASSPETSILVSLVVCAPSRMGLLLARGRGLTPCILPDPRGAVCLMRLFWPP